MAAAADAAAAKAAEEKKAAEERAAAEKAAAEEKAAEERAAAEARKKEENARRKAEEEAAAKKRHAEEAAAELKAAQTAAEAEAKRKAEQEREKVRRFQVALFSGFSSEGSGILGCSLASGGGGRRGGIGGGVDKTYERHSTSLACGGSRRLGMRKRDIYLTYDVCKRVLWRDRFGEEACGGIGLHARRPVERWGPQLRYMLQPISVGG